MTAMLGFGASFVLITIGGNESPEAEGPDGFTTAGPVGVAKVDWVERVQDAILRGDVRAATAVLARAPEIPELDRFRLLLLSPEVHAVTEVFVDREATTGPWIALIDEHIVDQDVSLRRLRERLACRDDRLDIQIRRSPSK